MNLYGGNVANLNVKGIPVTVRQWTDYPWDGMIDLVIQPQKEFAFSMFLRIPAWCRTATITVNDEEITEEVHSGEFLKLHRTWISGDRIRLSLSMPVEFVLSYPRLFENNGKVVLKGGPTVYCLEQVDNPDHDVWDIALRIDHSKIQAEWIPELLSGVMIIRGEAIAIDSDWSDTALYRASEASAARCPTIRLTSVPYYAWANRDPGPMTVWIRSSSAS